MFLSMRGPFMSVRDSVRWRGVLHAREEDERRRRGQCDLLGSQLGAVGRGSHEPTPRNTFSRRKEETASVPRMNTG
jgi:hypothetical protein